MWRFVVFIPTAALSILAIGAMSQIKISPSLVWYNTIIAMIAALLIAAALATFYLAWHEIERQEAEDNENVEDDE